MENPLISVLIPLFNSENTIEKCLASILNQTPQVFEVIIVDDGSTDASFDIVQKQALSDDRIHIYHQDNYGVARARQKLINHASGDYIMFCDSDDYLEPDAIQNVISTIDKYQTFDNTPDLFVFGYNLIRTYGNKTVLRRELKEGVYTKQQIAKYHVKGLNDLYWSSLWNKCYKKDLLLFPEIKFEKLIEDVMFNVDYMNRCKKICVSSICIYNYVQIGESLTRSSKKVDMKGISEAEEAYKLLKEKILETYPEEELAIMGYVYILNKQLEYSARNIGESNYIIQGGQELKQYLRFRTILLDCRFFFNRQKEKLKKRIKAFISIFVL